MIKIAYIQMIADLFHYGHLKLLETAKQQTGYLVVGLLSDEAAIEQRGKLIEDYKEREAVIKQLKCVDEITKQESQEPNDAIKEILKPTPDAKIYLFHGDDWDKIPGADFVKSIGGEVVTLPYYKRLGKDKLQISYKKDNKKSILSTKAQTLENLKTKLKKSKIEDLMKFNIKEWNETSIGISKIIRKHFHDKIVIRSSAISEDSYDESKAGQYRSILNVSANNTKKIFVAIAKVIRSMDSNPKNEILIQKQTEDIMMSGVVFTRKMETDAPYYVINYDDSGSTDFITSGKADKKVEIIRDIKRNGCSGLWLQLIDAIREIESLIPDVPLDIEFAITKKNEIVIFQVRPLAANKISVDIDNELCYMVKNMGSLFESGNAYSDMSFWNPAEIIGNLPNRLDYSLYKYIITDNHWNTALSTMGYNDVTPASLMKMFGGKPYIDLKLAFRALTPARLPEELIDGLQDFYFAKLFAHPELHDKIEFDIVYNCFNFNTNKSLNELEDDFADEEIKLIQLSLKMLNTKTFQEYQYWLNEADEAIHQMGKSRKDILRQIDHENRNHIILGIKNLLDTCIDFGTVDFSRLARYAFVANSILKSLVDQKLITKTLYNSFLNSLSVVRFGGHLRPGTYDITSPRYDTSRRIIKTSIESRKNIKIPADLSQKINDYEFLISAEEIFEFAKKTIEGREEVKFMFTKNLSDALELIAELGEKLGYTRYDMAQLDLDLIFWAEGKEEQRIKELWDVVINQRKKEKTIHEKLSLPPILFAETDFKIVPTYIAEPNFITQKNIEADTSKDLKSIKDKIVLIENADPGFDWIFNEDIKGLVTCYGGVASHMAIRCAEKGLPAAIGCGTEIYNKVKKSKRIKIDCKNKKIQVK